MDHQILDTSTSEEYEGIDQFREKILAILPIPSSILSIIGSSVILYMAFSTRKERKWTTYTRLLVGLSMCDIVSSISLGLAAFMRRPESERVWAMGNDATCAAAGTLIQFSYSGLFYNAFLSWYFVLTVRFGVKHDVIARKFEPIMHFISVGYPLVTAILGAILGVYAETSTGMGCWVNNYPDGCGEGPGQEKCQSAFLGFFYFGLPYVFSVTCIDINNLIIWFYVRKHRMPYLLNKTKQRSTARVNSSLFSKDNHDENSLSDGIESLDRELPSSIGSNKSSDGIIVNETDSFAASINHHKKYAQADDIDHSERDSSSRANKDQMRRLQLVSSQAFLFVLSYALCNSWMGLQMIAEGVTPEKDEPKLMNDIYGLMVLNAIFAPLQGFLNMLVFMRPKYVKARHQFPRETRAWAFRRAVLGDGVGPEQRGARRMEEPIDSIPNSGSATPQETQCTLAMMRPAESSTKNSIDQTNHSVPLPKGTMMMSSLTASLGDFDHDGQEEGMKPERTKGAFEASCSSIPRFHFRSSLVENTKRGLEAISELSESVFDLSNGGDRWSSSADVLSPITTSLEASRRFDAFRNDDTVPSSAMRLVAPKRMDSGCCEVFDEVRHEEDGIEPKREDMKEEEEVEEVEYAVDMPVRIPLRRLSMGKKSHGSHSFHDSCYYSSSISSSCSLIGFSDDDSDSFAEDNDGDGDHYDYTYRHEEEFKASEDFSTPPTTTKDGEAAIG
ncbi:unnamed protein product [Cylindrotheca closterium]|uniref:G-protein coupled receptors family 2 profile 2 domain-containing protein n=1 Tax=Cylindrotheca closterium TaxID=2856 RepID=A0AAD2GF84_9STRA|nr:unnamed protein product [Cylindrotheca closterium]